MKHFIQLLIAAIFMFSSFCDGQIIQGTLKFQSEPTTYNFITLKISDDSIICDSSGFFRFETRNNSSTLEVTPIPNHFRVKIYNIPSNSDTITLEEIPLFRNLDHGIPMISFTRKRTAKKFFKELEKEQSNDEKELIKKIEAQIYFWEQKEYKLKVVYEDGDSIIAIDLGAENI